MSGPEFLLIANTIPTTPTSNPMTMIAIWTGLLFMLCSGYHPGECPGQDPLSIASAPLAHAAAQ